MSKTRLIGPTKRSGTITKEEIERAKDNVLHYIKESSSYLDKNDVRGWFFVLYRAAKRKTPK
jgi:hypothetical protein